MKLINQMFCFFALISLQADKTASSVRKQKRNAVCFITKQQLVPRYTCYFQPLRSRSEIFKHLLHNLSLFLQALHLCLYWGYIYCILPYKSNAGNPWNPEMVFYVMGIFVMGDFTHSMKKGLSYKDS